MIFFSISAIACLEVSSDFLHFSTITAIDSIVRVDNGRGILPTSQQENSRSENASRDEQMERRMRDEVYDAS